MDKQPVKSYDAEFKQKVTSFQTGFKWRCPLSKAFHRGPKVGLCLSKAAYILTKNPVVEDADSSLVKLQCIHNQGGIPYRQGRGSQSDRPNLLHRLYRNKG